MNHLVCPDRGAISTLPIKEKREFLKNGDLFLTIVSSQLEVCKMAGMISSFDTNFYPASDFLKFANKKKSLGAKSRIRWMG